jgi:1-acyl-sn-glycerol-3-phosphate acyltransferase
MWPITLLREILGDSVDVDFTLWLTWLLAPLLITFLLPLVILLLLYASAVILYVYKFYRHILVHALESDFWDYGRTVVAALWDAHGWIWHGYEVEGLENIPDGPALFVYYHGTLPIDLYYFLARVYLLKNRLIHTVADRFLFKVPGWAIIAEGMKVIPGTIQTCSAILKAGNLLAISPGGVFEAQFGGPAYELMWKKRLGFAKVAIDAQVPIVPVFTQNVREAFRCVSWGRSFWLKVYQKTKFPMVPIYGGFPVKLITHVGPPILYDPQHTPEDLHTKAAEGIDALIRRHQRIPGSISRALTERLIKMPKEKTD